MYFSLKDVKTSVVFIYLAIDTLIDISSISNQGLFVITPLSVTFTALLSTFQRIFFFLDSLYPPPNSDIKLLSIIIFLSYLLQTRLYIVLAIEEYEVSLIFAPTVFLFAQTIV